MSVTISDAGSHFILSGETKESVDAALAGVARGGAQLISAPVQVGAKWMATFQNRRYKRAKVENLGMKTIITATSQAAVEAKIAELLDVGARLEQPAECVDGTWTAVCDAGR